VGKSGLILRFCLGEAILIEDCELVHCAFPVVGRTAPIGCDVAQRKPDQLGGRLVAGEMPARFDDFAQPRIDALDGIGGVDHPTHLGRESKERDYLVPRPTPGRHHGGEFLAPLAVLKGVEFAQRRLSADGAVDRFDGCGQGFAIRP